MENIDEDGENIKLKYELRPQIDFKPRFIGSHDPRKDGILLGLGLAKCGTTSLYTTFCTYSLLNSNCRLEKPEDKYWHSCINNHFQPKSTELFLYDIDNILYHIDNNTYPEDCSLDGWTYFSYIYSNPRGVHIRNSRSRTTFERWSKNETVDRKHKKNKRRHKFENTGGLVRGFHAKTTNHFGSIYIPHILNHMMVKYKMNLKMYVAFRNPMSRILSSYIFMVVIMFSYILYKL